MLEKGGGSGAATNRYGPSAGPALGGRAKTARYAAWPWVTRGREGRLTCGTLHSTVWTTGLPAGQVRNVRCTLPNRCRASTPVGGEFAFVFHHKRARNTKGISCKFGTVTFFSPIFLTNEGIVGRSLGVLGMVYGVGWMAQSISSLELA